MEKLTHFEFMKIFGVIEGAYYWAGDPTMILIKEFWKDYQEASLEDAEQLLELYKKYSTMMSTPLRLTSKEV